MKNTRSMQAGQSCMWVLFGFVITFAQMRGGGMMGDSSGMQGRCPMCGRQWDGSNNYTPTIPDSLPTPQNKQWIKRLERVMARERLSLAQYRKDVEKYRLHMPYSMIIPQEDNHIVWISQLYKALGMQAPDSIPSLRETNTGREALQVGMKLEQELIPDYELLIKNVENGTVKQILGDILYQTRMHFTMFQHALSMGGMMR